jgi:hypothetical protein
MTMSAARSSTLAPLKSVDAQSERVGVFRIDATRKEACKENVKRFDAAEFVVTGQGAKFGEC